MKCWIVYLIASTNPHYCSLTAIENKLNFHSDHSVKIVIN